MNITELVFLEKNKALFIDSHIEPPYLKGCSNEEIEYIEEYLSKKLPNILKEFLFIGGRNLLYFEYFDWNCCFDIYKPLIHNKIGTDFYISNFILCQKDDIYVYIPLNNSNNHLSVYLVNQLSGQYEIIYSSFFDMIDEIVRKRSNDI